MGRLVPCEGARQAGGRHLQLSGCSHARCVGVLVKYMISRCSRICTCRHSSGTRCTSSRRPTTGTWLVLRAILASEELFPRCVQFVICTKSWHILCRQLLLDNIFFYQNFVMVREESGVGGGAVVQESTAMLREWGRMLR